MKGTGARPAGAPTERELEAAVAEHGPRVLAVARRILQNESLAEEIAQETFLTFWRDPGAFVPSRGSLGGWLAAVARNKAIDAVRSEGSRTRRQELLAVNEDLPIDLPDLDTARSVRDAVARLTYLQREALFLAYFEGLTYREVAIRLGIPEGTAKTRLRDAMTGLRSLLQPLSAA